MLLNFAVEKTLESPLDCKEIQPVSPKGNHSWLFIGRTDAEDEAPILWPPDTKSQWIGKDSALGFFIVFSHLVMSNSLSPHGLQHTRLPCPSPSPGSCSNSCPSRRWCHPTISSSGERSLTGVCHKWPLLCCSKFPSSMPTFWSVSYYKWMLNLIKSVFCIS